jgi:hypothetical protein
LPNSALTIDRLPLSALVCSLFDAAPRCLPPVSGVRRVAVLAGVLLGQYTAVLRASSSRWDRRLNRPGLSGCAAPRKWEMHPGREWLGGHQAEAFQAVTPRGPPAPVLFVSRAEGVEKTAWKPGDRERRGGTTGTPCHSHSCSRGRGLGSTSSAMCARRRTIPNVHASCPGR